MSIKTSQAKKPKRSPNKSKKIVINKERSKRKNSLNWLESSARKGNNSNKRSMCELKIKQFRSMLKKFCRDGKKVMYK